MALLKPAFLRAHPVRSGMVWAAGFAALFLLLIFVTDVIPITATGVALLIICSIMGGLTWGYSMKAVHDRRAGAS